MYILRLFCSLAKHQLTETNWSKYHQPFVHDTIHFSFLCPKQASSFHLSSNPGSSARQKQKRVAIALRQESRCDSKSCKHRIPLGLWGGRGTGGKTGPAQDFLAEEAPSNFRRRPAVMGTFRHFRMEFSRGREKIAAAPPPSWGDGTGRGGTGRRK